MDKHKSFIHTGITILALQNSSFQDLPWKFNLNLVFYRIFDIVYRITGFGGVFLSGKDFLYCILNLLLHLCFKGIQRLFGLCFSFFFQLLYLLLHLRRQRQASAEAPAKQQDLTPTSDVFRFS